MTISKQKNGNALTLAVAGRLDTITSPELEAVLVVDPSIDVPLDVRIEVVLDLYVTWNQHGLLPV